MSKPANSYAALACAISALVAAPVARAESGSYEMLYAFVTNYAKLEQPGRTITAGSISGTQTVLRSSGAPFAEGSNNVTDCLVYAKRTDSNIDVEAYCTSTYPSGDKMFSVSQRRSGDMSVGGGGAGKVQILGGTGQYASISGDCAYTTSYLPGNHVVNRLECRWQKP
jgi:hypothetical protein